MLTMDLRPLVRFEITVHVATALLLRASNKLLFFIVFWY